MKPISFVGISKQFINIEKEILDKFIEIGRKGNYVLGNYVEAFEDKFSKYIGSKYGIAVNSGSDALFLILKALNIGKGDEVITTPNSFIATAWVIAATGAKIKFVDIDNYGLIDCSKIEKAITRRTKAIIPVHLSGIPAEMSKINKIAKRKSIYVIEDAAQSVGSVLNNKKTGSFGIAGAFSLHPLKNLGVMGDGGVITTDSKNLSLKLKKLRNHGLKNRNVCEMWGYKSRLDEEQASIALIKMKYLKEWKLKCDKIAKIYNENLCNVVEIPTFSKNIDPFFHNYIIKTNKRNKLKKYLTNNNIETNIHYPIPLHLQTPAIADGYRKGDFPNTEKLVKKILSLPIYPELQIKEAIYISKKIKKFFN